MTQNSNKPASQDANGMVNDTPVPPPIPPPTFPSRNSSPLSSPWWLAEPTPEPEQDKSGGRWLLSYTKTLRFGEIDERCVLLTRGGNAKAGGNVVERSADCRMVCLSREKPQTHQKSWNPLQGTWLVVATTASRCREHVAAKRISKKSEPDYYTIELGGRLSRSSEDVKRIVKKTFSPLQELTQRYLDSWRDGTQAAFFARFWSSAKRGDAFQLMDTSIRRLINMPTKKDGDKKNNN